MITNVRMTSAAFVLGIGLIETVSFLVMTLILRHESASRALDWKALCVCMTLNQNMAPPMRRYVKRVVGRLMSFQASVRRSVLEASTAWGPVTCAFKDAANLNSMKTGFATYSSRCPSHPPFGDHIKKQVTRCANAFP